MVGISLAFSLLLGLPLGFIVFLTRRGMLWDNKFFNWLGELGINLIRSLPFVILLILILPLALLVTGRTTGPYAASVPLSIACIAFYARLVEGALCEVSQGVIEAARAHGASDWLLIRRVLYPESFAGLVRGFTVTAISLVGYSAMAGVVGGGGIGFLAINYGYYRYETPIMIVTVVVLIVIVQVLQSAGDYVAHRLDHKK
ncbi:MAG: methionine ABC transporter permease [Chthoniobacteraceae bacterium]